MSTAAVPPASSTGLGLAGHNRISTQALTSTAKGAAAEHFSVPAQQIRIVWADDGGLLALSISLPLQMPGLERIEQRPEAVERMGGSLWERAHAAKPVLLHRLTELTGARIASVDVRVTGVLLVDGSRVR